MKLNFLSYIFFFIISFLGISENKFNKKPFEIIKPDSDLNFDKVKPDLTVDFRNSGIGTITRPRLIGFNFGLKIHARNRIGFGFYTLTHNAVKPVGLEQNGEPIEQSNGVFKINPTLQPNRQVFFYYGNLAYSHYFIQNKYFEFQTPLEIGFGSYEVKYLASNAVERPLINPDASTENQNYAETLIKNPAFLNRSSTFIPISLGMTFSLKLHTFIWPFANGGYRFVVNAPEFSDDFNGFFYNFGVSLDIFGIGKWSFGLFGKR
ncbi:MAG: hypothetical protein EAZ27_10700 [Cytophagales bacterium]|nr:MAG: hypothetical protein EAZ27_10700 [Cytophagales bacterium]